jgi:hypothetical protein
MTWLRRQAASQWQETEPVQVGSEHMALPGAKKLSQRDNWGYVCCMIAKGSSCYEKHREGGNRREEFT